MNAEEIYKKLDEGAGKCPACGERKYVRNVRFGSENEIVAEYECRNPECRYNKYKIYGYRRLFFKEAEEVMGLFTPEEVKAALLAVAAAMAAEVTCPDCGKKMQYTETNILRSGKLVHKFRCKNSLCITKPERLVEIRPEDRERIIKSERDKHRCAICGKAENRTWIHCMKHGLICESHCEDCPEPRDGTSLDSCLYNSFAERERKQKAELKEYLARKA